MHKMVFCYDRNITNTYLTIELYNCKILLLTKTLIHHVENTQ